MTVCNVGQTGLHCDLRAGMIWEGHLVLAACGAVLGLRRCKLVWLRLLFVGTSAKEFLRG